MYAPHSFCVCCAVFQENENDDRAGGETTIPGKNYTGCGEEGVCRALFSPRIIMNGTARNNKVNGYDINNNMLASLFGSKAFL